MSELATLPIIFFSDATRDCWTENLRCQSCGTTGDVQLSMPDKFSFDVEVDCISDGFKATALKYGSQFFCCLCGISATASNILKGDIACH